MILLDANILLYAHLSLSDHHRAIRQWLDQLFIAGRPVRLAWITIVAFLRISTNPRLSGQPLLMKEAVMVVNDWLAQSSVDILAPGERHWDILQKILADSQIRGPLATDAHLAALAIEHGATLSTCDRDFTRFKGVRLVNPLDVEA